MIPEIEQLCETDPTQIDDIIALTDRRLAVWSSRNGGAHRQHKAAEILVQREQLQHLPRQLGVGRLLSAVLAVGVCGNILGVQVIDLVDVEWDATLVPSTSPLRV